MGDDVNAAPDPDEAKAHRVTKWIVIVGGGLIGLIGPAYTAYQFAASEAKTAAAKVATATVDLAADTKVVSQATKNEAEAGYQVLLKQVEGLLAREAARERAGRIGRHRPARPPAPVRALPQDLKKAEQAVSNASTSPTTVASPQAMAGSTGRADAGP